MTDITEQLQNMREEYEGTPLRKANLNECPFAQFSSWLKEAQYAGVPDPNACSLGTVDEKNKPMARAVLLKGLEDDKFTFYTNYNSRKANHLNSNPFATMHFPWFSMERQVVVAGRVEKLAIEKSEEYFKSRPLLSRLGAWASQQSKPLDSRETLERHFWMPVINMVRIRKNLNIGAGLLWNLNQLSFGRVDRADCTGSIYIPTIGESNGHWNIVRYYP